MASDDQSDGEPATIASHSTSTIVKVFVGEERKLFNLHESLLCQKCLFFEKCLSKSFEEGKTLQVNLENEEVEAFEQFVLWIYNQPLTVENQRDIALCYILADKFLVEAFKNMVVDTAKVECRKKTLSMDGLVELYENALSQSPLANYLWAQLAFELINAGFEKYISQVQYVDGGGALSKLLQAPENLITFMRVLDQAWNKYGRREDLDPSTMDGCLYHEHKETKPCKAVKMKVTVGKWWSQ